MNPITEFKQLYLTSLQDCTKMRLKFPLSSLPKFFLVYNNTVVEQKYLYSYYAFKLAEPNFSLLEGNSETATMTFIKRNLYPDYKSINTTSITSLPSDFYFPLPTATFFKFQFIYSDLPYVAFNRLFRLLMYICVNCYRVNAAFFCGIKQFCDTFGFDKEAVIKMLSRLEKDKWIKCKSVGNNLKNQTSSYIINLELIDFNFFCDNKSANSTRNLSNFCFKED